MQRLPHGYAQVRWGHHSMTEAMRLLLAAAVADPTNQRFQFVDEATIPLYPPQLVWAQLMGETKTRMSACQVRGHAEQHQRSSTSCFA